MLPPGSGWRRAPTGDAANAVFALATFCGCAVKRRKPVRVKGVAVIDIADKNHQPTVEELGAFIGNPLLPALCEHMKTAHKALMGVEYSGDNVLLGWNVRFHKGGRTLCRLYPKRGHFIVLVVVGRKEKERTEALLPRLSAAMRAVYQSAREGMGQRWLLLDLNAPNALFEDVLKLIEIRKESR